MWHLPWSPGLVLEEERVDSHPPLEWLCSPFGSPSGGSLSTKECLREFVSWWLSLKSQSWWTCLQIAISPEFLTMLMINCAGAYSGYIQMNQPRCSALLPRILSISSHLLISLTKRRWNELTLGLSWNQRSITDQEDASYCISHRCIHNNKVHYGILK